MITAIGSATLLIYVVRIYFLATSASVVVARIVPSLHKTFNPYGKTRAPSLNTPQSFVQHLSNITVPKSWFWHYYLLIVLLSVFWGIQFIVCSSDCERYLLRWMGDLDGTSVIVWGMMLVQGYRRLFESLYVQKPSPSRMWIGHYLVGCAFYVMMSIAVFAEGSSRPPGIVTFHLISNF